MPVQVNVAPFNSSQHDVILLHNRALVAHVVDVLGAEPEHEPTPALVVYLYETTN